MLKFRNLSELKKANAMASKLNANSKPQRIKNMQVSQSARAMVNSNRVKNAIVKSLVNTISYEVEVPLQKPQNRIQAKLRTTKRSVAFKALQVPVHKTKAWTLQTTEGTELDFHEMVLPDSLYAGLNVRVNGLSGQTGKFLMPGGDEVEVKAGKIIKVKKLETV